MPEKNSLRAAVIVFGLAIVALIIIVGVRLAATKHGQTAVNSGDVEQYDPRNFDGSFKYTNSLIHQTSPYLLQDAHNPINWQPWGEAAFAEAKRRDQPIFLSIGYSTCHWCHVMERESFSQEDVAYQINRDFVPVLIDREEHPEIDEVYQQAAQIESGSAGWPATLVLLPNGEPFFAGNYLPKDALKTALTIAAQSYLTDRHKVQTTADNVMEQLRQAEATEGVGGETVSPAQADQKSAAAIAELAKDFDSVNGGFGGAPKFPPFSALNLIFNRYAKTHDPKLLSMATLTLNKMALGGIHDQLGGGFFRYATDVQWRVPHFEKMLSDNAQMGIDYGQAYALTHDPYYKSVADDTYGWAFTHLMDAKTGGFHNALDADAGGVEGGAYLWTLKQVTDLLGAEDGAEFANLYHVSDQGNYADPATGLESNSNILYLDTPIRETPRMAALHEKLLAVRNKRIQPKVDIEEIASQNGLMISSLADASRLLDEPKYAKAAVRAANFAWSIYVRPDGSLWHSVVGGKTTADGILDDYAYLANGLLDLAQTTGSKVWADRAEVLADQIIKRFANPIGGGFFEDASEANLPLRIIDPYDDQLPSANGVAAIVFARLAQIDKSPVYAQEADATIGGFAQDIDASPSSSASLIEAAEDLGHVKTGTATTPAVKSPVTLAADPTSITLQEGATVQVNVKISIAPGWHINSNQPFETDLIPTGVGMATNSDPQVTGSVYYPLAKTIKPILSDTKLSVYTGTITIPVQLTAADMAAMGTHAVKLMVQYQPCNDSLCLAPVTATLPVTVTIEGS